MFWVQRPFQTVFQSISGRLQKRGRKRRERIDKSKNVQTTPPLPTANALCPCSTVIEIVVSPAIGPCPTVIEIVVSPAIGPCPSVIEIVVNPAPSQSALALL